MRRRQRRRRGGWALAAAASALLLLAALTLRLLGDLAPPAAAPLGGAWTLTGSDGRTVTDRDFRGRFLLLYFGYTACPDVCPTTLAAASAALDRLGHRGDRVQPVFVTVDPGRDTPAVLGRYVGGFGSRLIGLTGTATQIGRIEREYGVSAVLHPDGGIDHSAVLYLVAPDGAVRAAIAADESDTAMAADLARHLE